MKSGIYLHIAADKTTLFLANYLILLLFNLLTARVNKTDNKGLLAPWLQGCCTRNREQVEYPAESPVRHVTNQTGFNRLQVVFA